MSGLFTQHVTLKSTGKGRDGQDQLQQIVRNLISSRCLGISTQAKEAMSNSPARSPRMKHGADGRNTSERKRRGGREGHDKGTEGGCKKQCERETGRGSLADLKF
eukprot:759222-Hanusia_phi.AAC.2